MDREVLPRKGSLSACTSRVTVAVECQRAELRRPYDQHVADIETARFGAVTAIGGSSGAVETLTALAPRLPRDAPTEKEVA